MWNVCTYVIFCFIILLEGLLRCTVLRLRPRWPLSRREKPSAAGVTTCYFLFSKPLGHRLHHHQIYRYIYYVCVCVCVCVHIVDWRTYGWNVVCRVTSHQRDRSLIDTHRLLLSTFICFYFPPFSISLARPSRREADGAEWRAVERPNNDKVRGQVETHL